MEAAFRELASEGIKLEEQVRGYILFRHASLSQVQEDQVTTWTQGKYGPDDVVKAIRKLEKVNKEKSIAKTYLAEDEVPEKEEDSEEYVYLGENDLDEILEEEEEEEEVLEALASYQQVRRAIREQKNNRGYFDSKSSGKGSSSKSGASWRLNFSAGDGRIRLKSTSERGAKVHVDVLKLRTRCAKCGVLSDPSRSHPRLLRI